MAYGHRVYRLRCAVGNYVRLRLPRPTYGQSSIARQQGSASLRFSSVCGSVKTRQSYEVVTAISDSGLFTDVDVVFKRREDGAHFRWYIYIHYSFSNAVKFDKVLVEFRGFAYESKRSVGVSRSLSVV